MRREVLLMVTVLLASCTGGGGAAGDAGSSDAAGLAACRAGAFRRDAAREGKAPALQCGGQIWIAGVTPFGFWEANCIGAEITAPPEFSLEVILAAEPPSGPRLTFQIPFNVGTGNYLGDHDLLGFLENGGETVPASVHAEVTSAVAPYKPDGGHQDDAAARIVLVVTMECGTFGAAVIAPYTGWQPPSDSGG